MAHRSVPDFPAVQLVLEHLKELNRQLTEERASPEASVHLTALTAAVSALEAGRRAAHEQLETESIQNSKLRHRIKNTSDRMKEEMMADVAAARTSNAAEMEQLREDLRRLSPLLEECGEKLQTLVNQNKTLHTEREQVKADYEAVIADLNDLIDLQCNQQGELNQKLQLTEQIKSCITVVQQENTSFWEITASERKACSEEKLSLSREMEQMEERVEKQKEVTEQRRGALEGVKDRRGESLQRLGELAARLDEEEKHLQSLAASRRRFEQQLEETAERSKHLCQQMETLEEESQGLKVIAKTLQEEMGTVERKIDEERAAGLLLTEEFSQLREVFKYRHNEENRARVEHLCASQHLKRSRLQLEERVASIVVHSSGIKEMEKEIRELQDAEALARQEFERSREELRGDLEMVRDKICRCEEDKKRFAQLLEESRSRQEEHVERVTSDIVRVKRRYEELLQEEAALLQLQPKSADTDLLQSYVTRTEAEYKQTEIILLQEVQAIDAEIHNLCRSTEERRRELEEKEEVQEDLEVKWTETLNEYDRLTRELSLKKTRLELSIRHTQNQTELLLRPKQDLKARLEELQETHLDLVRNQTSELLTAEVSIYNDAAMLRRVREENSRMDLCLRQMTEDLRTNQQEEQQLLQEEQKVKHETKNTVERFQEAWRQDVELIEKSQSREQDLLDSMNSLMNKVRSREKQLVAVLSLLHHNMLQFSKRLGDTATSTSDT